MKTSKEVKDLTTGALDPSEIETFIMCRTTEGLSWLLKFNNLTELQLLIFMLELENPRSKNIITFGKLQLKETSSILGVAEITIKKCIHSLVEKDFLIRVARTNYLINPTTFYRGRTVKLQDRIQEYERWKETKTNISENVTSESKSSDEFKQYVLETIGLKL